MLKIGTKVKDFCLRDAYNETHCLSEYLGKKVVIYFYPKDKTPGCTAQACAFRDAYDGFKRKDIVVIGISKDSVKSHLEFATEYNLPFILLSDEDKKVIEYFGVWGEKKMYGKTHMGVLRTTFLLDENGVISHVFENAIPSSNASDILKVIE